MSQSLHTINGMNEVCLLMLELLTEMADWRQRRGGRDGHRHRARAGTVQAGVHRTGERASESLDNDNNID